MASRGPRSSSPKPGSPIKPRSGGWPARRGRVGREVLDWRAAVTVGTSVDWVVARTVCNCVEVFCRGGRGRRHCSGRVPERRASRLGLVHVRGQVVEHRFAGSSRRRNPGPLKVGHDVLERRENALDPGGAAPEELVARDRDRHRGATAEAHSERLGVAAVIACRGPGWLTPAVPAKIEVEPYWVLARLTNWEIWPWICWAISL